MPLIYPIGFLARSTPVSYTTWNVSDKSANISLSGGNLIASITSTVNSNAVRSVSSKSTGKWYFEITWTTRTVDGDDISLGVGNASASLSAFVGDANGWGIQPAHVSGAFQLRHNNSNTALTTTGTPASGDVYMFAWDADAGKLWFGRGGTWPDAGAGAGNPAAGTNPTATSVAGTLFIMGSDQRNGDVFTLNAGASSFNTAAPSGFSGWTA
jgi:hypothetical protein